MEYILSQRLSLDEGKPSLFELLSEQQLNALLPPTVRYILTLLTHRYPRHLLRILNRFDELYALFALLIERHWLHTRGGSFTEHFYGLKREKALAEEIPRASSAAPGAVSQALKLSSRDIWKNLAVIVGLPYLKRKLDEAYEVDAPRAMLGAAYNAPPAPGAPAKEKAAYWWRMFLRRVYPTLNAAYYLSVLGFNLAYLFDGSKYHHPFLWMIGTRVRRMNAADYKAVEELEERMRQKGGARGSVAARLAGALSLALPASIFALKFLEWWHASDFAKQLSRRAAESLDLPPPVVSGLSDKKPVKKLKKEKEKEDPQQGEGSEKKDGEEGEEDPEEKERRLRERAPVSASSYLPIFTVPVPASTDLCPICENEITTPTACQTGIVYCYACIHKWLAGTHPRQEKFMVGREGKWESGEGRCPVTGRKVLGGVEGLRRIMV
ncbi:putative peroxisome protein [Thermochaetoides thermophila DSM 1495]|uniref:Peroxisome assembly protein 12 n=1 Tax=Chaetomium thermophilum (strain DSM 1495 / CBS 144.50 / IMI 039719) TaxID=759272 RepID=G0S3R2_CHATD|nr:putative peroxisome protein [Thermochaetoides thermophila DSM 1495]EGS21188.1 putative peroxisome protein [Thermochaetoides thermophila DSM 1495]